MTTKLQTTRQQRGFIQGFMQFLCNFMHYAMQRSTPAEPQHERVVIEISPEETRRRYAVDGFERAVSAYDSELGRLEEDVKTQERTLRTLREEICALEREVEQYRGIVSRPVTIDRRALYYNNHLDQPQPVILVTSAELRETKQALQFDLDTILFMESRQFEEVYEKPREEYVRAGERVLRIIEDALVEKQTAEETLLVKEQALQGFRRRRDSVFEAYLTMKTVYERKRAAYSLLKTEGTARETLIRAASRVERLDDMEREMIGLIDSYATEEVEAYAILLSNETPLIRRIAANGSAVIATGTEIARIEEITKER